MIKLNKLSPELERKFPSEIRKFRSFFSDFFSDNKIQFISDCVEKSKQDKAYLRLIDELSDEEVGISKLDKIYCYSCGKTINSTSRFCEHCGIKQDRTR